MELKELHATRHKAQKITNILDKDFDFTWDWIDYEIEKWETQTHPYYLAEHCAKHMARVYCGQKNNKCNYVNDAGKLVDKIMWKEYIEYSTLSKKQATILAKERKIALDDDKWNDKGLKTLIKDLKETH